MDYYPLFYLCGGNLFLNELHLEGYDCLLGIAPQELLEVSDEILHFQLELLVLLGQINLDGIESVGLTNLISDGRLDRLLNHLLLISEDAGHQVSKVLQLASTTLHDGFVVVGFYDN